MSIGSSILGLSHLWSHHMDSTHWYGCTVHSHAAALIVVYLLWSYPRRLSSYYENHDKLLRPSRSEVSLGKTKDQEVSDDIDLSDSDLSSPTSSASTDSDDVNFAPQNKINDQDEKLSTACPTATPAERKRFLTARQGNVVEASRALANYLEWNRLHEKICEEHSIERPSTGNSDVDIWQQACAIAMKAGEEEGGIAILPRVIRTHQIDGKTVTDLDGHLILHIIPAQMDITLAKTSTYALAVALYMNLQLDREEDELITVCMDARAGRGWPNIHIFRSLPFLKDTVTLLLTLFPERLHKCLIYPVPLSYMWVWNAVRCVIDPETREKICVLSGPNKIEAVPPFEQMYDHMTKDIAHYLENVRISEFKEDEQED